VTTRETFRSGDPDLAAQLRRLVDSLWITAGEDADQDVSSILRKLSQEIELLARKVEARETMSAGRRFARRH
jgi:hypothetical protein